MPAQRLLTPEQRSLRARIAANVRWSREDPKPTPSAPRPACSPSSSTRLTRTGCCPRPSDRAGRGRPPAHMQQLAFRSSKARTRKAAP